MAWLALAAGCGPAPEPAAPPAASAPVEQRQEPSPTANLAVAGDEAPGWDLAEVSRRARHRARLLPDGALQVKGAWYEARYDARGELRFWPGRQEAASLRWKTASVRVGAHELLRGEPVRSQEGPEVTYSWEGLRERYTHDEGHAEQLWELEELPAQGDLVIEGRVQGGAFAGESARGLHFSPEGGEGLLVRYSPATVFDAAGRRLEVAPRWDAGRGLVSMTIPSAWLAQAEAPVVVDPTFSAESGMDTPLYTPSGRARAGLRPDVAVGGAQALAVWVEDNAAVDPAGSGVYATLTDLSGMPMGAPIALASGDFSYSRPSVAWNGTNWLVTWSDNRSGAQRLYGATVAGTDQAVTQLTLDSATAGIADPDVGSDGTGWLVVYEGTNNGTDVYYVTVAANGAVGTPARINAAGNQVDPKVAGAGGRYALVWDDAGATIRAQGFRNGSLQGSVRALGSADTPGRPDVSCYMVNGSNSTCVAVWQSNAGGMDIFGALLSVANNGIGAPPAAVTLISGAPAHSLPSISATSGSTGLAFVVDGADVAVASLDGTLQVSGPVTLAGTADEETRPQIVHAGSNLLVAWNDQTDTTIQARTSSVDLQTLGTVYEVNRGANAQASPAVSSVGNGFLAAWVDQRGNTPPELYATRLQVNSNALQVNDQNGLALATGAAQISAPAVCDDGTDYVVVWVEDGDALMAARVSAGGSVGTPVTVRSGGGQIEGPDCASGATGSFQVIWREVDDGLTSVEGRLLSSGTGVDLTVGAAATVVTSADGPNRAAIAGVANNTYVVWSNASGALKARRIDGAGAPQNMTTLVMSGVSGDGVDISAMGSFLVSAYGLTANNGDISVIRCDRGANFTNIKTPLALSTGADSDRRPRLATLGGARVVAGWSRDPSGVADLYQAEVVVAEGAPEGLALSGAVSEIVSGARRERDLAMDANANELVLFAFEAFSQQENASRVRATLGRYNRSPVAALATPGGTTVTEGGSLSFNASGSTDPDPEDMNALSYAWDFGDGQTATGVMVTHTFADNDNDSMYTVTLTVTDNFGASDTEAVVVTVNNAAPTITNVAANPTPSNEGASVTFSVTASDPGGDAISYTWSFGDGTMPETTSNTTIAHTFANGTATRTVSVTARDDEDAASAPSALMHTVNNVLPTVELGNTITINEGGAAMLNGTATDPSPTDQAALVYNWVFGNGALNNAAPIQSRTYAQDGNFTVTLTVADDTGTTTDSVMVVVNNVAPVANAGANITINEGATATFAGSATDPGTMDALTYTWDFGDGSPVASGVDLTAPTHTYVQQGTYTVTLRVADDDTFDEDDLTVTVNNVPPTVEVGANRTVAEGTPVVFNAVATDPGADTLTYNWDYGDGQTGTNVGATPSHTYNRPGSFLVQVTVSDGTASVTDSLTVTVTNTAPTVAMISGTATGNEGDTYSFATTASEPGQAQGALLFNWSFGDGTSQSGAGLASVNHVYADDDADDMYTVTLTVDDGEGGGGQTTRTFTTTVRNKNPANATITSNNTVAEGVPISFVGAATDVPGDPLTYSWNFGDGQTAQGASVSYAYADQANRTVTLTVTDGDGGMATVTKAISVTNVAPAITMDASRTVNQGAATSFTAQVFDVPADPVTFTWSVTPNNGITLNPSTGNVTGGAAATMITFANAGTYMVRLTASDDDNGTSMATTTVTVGNGVPVVSITADENPIDEGDFAAFNLMASDPSRIQRVFIEYGDNDDEETTGLNLATYLATKQHLYVEDGPYTVRFEATDNDNGGTTASVTFNLTVNNVPPTVSINLPQNIEESVSTLISVTVTDPSSVDSAEMICTWSFGDGSNPVTNNCAPVSHTWPQDGAYTLTVTADDGEDETEATASVVVANRAPQVTFVAPNNVSEGNSVTLSATVVELNPNDTLSYTWNLGDGQTRTTNVPMLNYTWADNGPYTVTLDVNDGTDVTRRVITVAVANLPPTVEAGGNRSVGEGAPLAMAGSAADAAGPRDTLTYCWDYDDGTAVQCGVELRTPSHTWADDGVYEVVLTVSDEDGGQTSDSLTVTVNNLPPTVDAGNNRTVNEGSTLTLTGTATDPAGARDPLTYRWTFGDGNSAQGASVTHTYAQQGSYTATLTVTDDAGASASDTLTVTVNNVAPTVNAGNDQTINEGGTANLAGTATDPGADTLTYTWDFGDSSPTATGRTQAHRYVQQGTYTVRLTVNDGTVNVTDTLVVTVNNVAPTVNAGLDRDVNESGSITFAATVTDPGADTLAYTWDFGDGSPVVQGNSLNTPQHTYDDDSDCGDDNICVVTLTVSDGTVSVADTLLVTVNNVAPTVNPGNDQRINEGGTVTFNGTATDPANNKDPLTWTWNFGDGSDPVSGRNLRTPQHTFVDDLPTGQDVYTVTVTVTDGDGGSTTQTLRVTVDNVAPTVNAGQNLTSDEGRQVQFGASATDPGGANDPLTYTWDFGDGSPTLSGIDLTAPTHVFDDDDNYLVAVTVTDGDGGSVTGTLRVTVSNVSPRISLAQDIYNVNEGASLTLAARAADPGADPLSYRWVFGDGDSAADIDLTEVDHAWADDGIYAASLTVTDDDGGQAREDIEVRVTNVAPTITSNPVGFGAQGQQYSYQVQISDPGVEDTHTYTLLEGPIGTGNARMTISSTGLVTWTPSAQQALAPEPHRVRVRVQDDDGGDDTQEWLINLNFTDTDMDTLPDVCEQRCANNGLDPNNPNDPDADLDGDNISNLDECLRDTNNLGNACSFNGPGAPILTSPNNLLLEEYPVDLIVTNAVDPDEDPLTYTFEILLDGLVVFSRDSIPETRTTTRLRIQEGDFAFQENTLYQWRARAHDPLVNGPWPEQPASFRFSLTNDPPSTPALRSPFAQPPQVATVNIPRPTLTVANALDPEREPVTYSFEVYTVDQNDVRTLVTQTVNVPEGELQTSWTVNFDLNENTFYVWRARAVDARNAQSPWTELAPFQVNTVNTPPGAPTLLLPAEDEVLDSPDVVLVASAAVDIDEDPLTYTFTLALDGSFAQDAILASSSPLTADGRGQLAWSPDVSWQEGQRYHWRVQAFDPTGGGQSAQRSFRFSVQNQAPPAPTLQSPAGGDASPALAPNFVWMNVVDPDGDEIVYAIEVLAILPNGAQRMLLAEGITPDDGPTTSWQGPALEDNQRFQWRVTVEDARGASNQSALADFLINVRNEAPTRPEPIAPLLPTTFQLGDPVTLLWKNAYDPDADPITYAVEVYRNDGVAALVFNAPAHPESDGDTTDLTIPAELLTQPGAYRWNVVASDGRLPSVASAEGGFQIVMDAPSTEPPADREIGRPEPPAPSIASRPARIDDCSQLSLGADRADRGQLLLALGLLALTLLARRRR